MKLKTTALLTLLLLFTTAQLKAQAPTTEGSEYTYLYKLNKEQVRWMIDSPWVSLNNWLFTNVVDSVRHKKRETLNFKNHPKGYYISYNTHHLAITTNLHIEQQFFPTVQETNGQWWFIMRDTLQNIIKNGTLTLIKNKQTKGDTLFTYDSSCMCYPVPKQVKHQWFLFEADGQFYYMHMNSPYQKAKRKWWKFWKRARKNKNGGGSGYGYGKPRIGRRILYTITHPFRKKWTPMSADPGYMVTNQPKYKHGDTLKMKAFLVNRKGKPFKKNMELLMVTPRKNNYGQDTVLRTTLKPSPAGAYTYEMAIPDSFIIDRNYTLLINRKRRTYEQITFKVEQYELNKITYTWEDKKQEYYRGNSIFFYAKAIDANNLPVPDATVHLKLHIQNINTIYDTLIKLHDTVFRSYFDTTLQCSPDGLTPIELPGHLIPNADITVTGEMFFTNADNKPGYQSHYFNILANTQRYYLMQDSNGLRSGYLVQGKDQRGKTATWRVNYHEGYYKDKKITLPYYHNWEAGARSYALLDSAGTRTLANYQMPANPPKAPSFTIDKQYDSIYISLENPLGLEVAWRIYDNDDELLTKGAGATLSYSKKLKGTKPVRVRYSYSWAGNFYTFETVGWRKEKQLTVKIEHPELVFPGQTIPVDITVTNYKNKPAKNVNLTAYSVNTEFDNIPVPNMPYYGKSYGSKLQKRMLNYPSSWVNSRQNSFIIKGELFYKLQLYKHPYYRLLYNSNAIGIEHDSLANNKTQLTVNVHSDMHSAGDYYALWIDDELVYLHFSQSIPNAFRVSVGKHNIKVRAYEYMYELNDIECVAGMRTLVGINGDSAYNNTHIKRTLLDKTGLTKAEKQAYNPNNQKTLFIGSQNSNYYHKLQNTYLRQGDKTYKLSNFPSSNYYVQHHYYTPVGPFTEGEVEFIIPNDTAFSFYFNPRFMYLYNGKSLNPHKESYSEIIVSNLSSQHRFADTATEIPAPIVKKEEPKTNTIIHYQSKNPLTHPAIRDYYPYEYAPAQINKYPFTTYINKHGAPARMWFFNQDSLQYSLIKNSMGSGAQNNLIPGNYTIVMFTDTNSYKILYNVAIDSAYRYFYRPTLDYYQAFDSTVLLPYIAQVKYLNRGPIPPFYNTPVKVDVRLDTEPSKQSEKLIGEFTVNGRHINNALIVVEDGKGHYINGGLSNQYGFYQIPLNVGTYTLKIYTPQWDMFYVENVSISRGNNTIANINVSNYTAQIANNDYNYLPAQQRNPQPTSTGRQPNYNNSVKGNCTNNCGELRGLVKDAQTNEELIGVSLQIEGTTVGIATDIDGSYRFSNISEGKHNIIVKYIGYQTQKINNIVINGGQTTTLNINLRENTVEAAEVFITSDKERYKIDADEVYNSPSYSNAESIQSIPMRSVNQITNTVAGSISIAGARTSGTAYYVDGVRLLGDITVGDEQLDDIALVERQQENQRLLQMLGDSTAMRNRKEFRDYGFWVPNLTTNRKGKAGFSVRLPDNQTQWATFVPAMDGRKQTGLGTSYIKAYKPITANLSLPRFMVAGDKLQITGKTVNYTADSVVLNALLRVNDSTLYNSPMGVRYFELISQFLQLSKAGTYSLQYSVKMENGYTDGDIRQLKVLENGLLINEGETRTLEGSVNLTLAPQQGHVNRQVLLSNRKAELLLAEINQLKSYQYGCVEQTASKLKALLLEKQFQTALNVEFSGEKQIKNCINRLEKFQNKNGSWGWWDKSPTDNFMTIYAADALTRAQKAGYSTNAGLTAAHYLYNNYHTLSIPQRLDAVALLTGIKYGGDIAQKQIMLDKLNLTLQERLMALRNRQLMGQKVNTDTVLKSVRNISATQAAWGEKLFSIYVNELQTSAIAYEILRHEGGHEALLKKVRNYFLSQSPTQRNTIQSATLLQTFLQDIVDEDAKRNELVPILTLNGKIDKRPSIKLELADDETLTIGKQGSELFYLYAWKKFVANPAAASNTFKINTRLVQNQHASDTVEAGKPVTLQIDISLPKDREYVMLEVPIPAGFSYRSKLQSSRYNEIYREYFEDKVSMFFGNLPSGHYTFTIELLPQFKGEATLLPARAEEMYFPMNSGNNTKRTVVVK